MQIIRAIIAYLLYPLVFGGGMGFVIWEMRHER